MAGASILANLSTLVSIAVSKTGKGSTLYALLFQVWCVVYKFMQYKYSLKSLCYIAGRGGFAGEPMVPLRWSCLDVHGRMERRPNPLQNVQILSGDYYFALIKIDNYDNEYRRVRKWLIDPSQRKTSKKKTF